MQPTIGSSVNRLIPFSGEFDPPMVLGGGANTTPPGATAHTFSAWREYIASTAEDWDGVRVMTNFQPNNGATSMLFQIGVGAAGSEVVFATMTQGMQLGYTESLGHCTLPKFIPRGSRIAVRWQVRIAWPTTERPLFIIGLQGNRIATVRRSYGMHAELGVNLSETRGDLALSVAYGDYAWREITAAAPFRVRKLVLTFSTTEFSFTNPRVLSIGYGTAGSEREITQDFQFAFKSFYEFDVDIPAGARIVHRLGQQSNSSANSGTFVAHLFG